MCKACKMDPSEVARFRQRQGAVDAEDFYKEVNYRPKKKVSTRVRRTRPGCAANDNGPHVYVYTTEHNIADLFHQFYGYHKWEKSICCGCGKSGHKSRLTERYEKVKSRKWNKRYGGEFNVQRGKPLSYWGRHGPSYGYWAWENYEDDFNEFYRTYMTQHGWTRAVYGNQYHW